MKDSFTPGLLVVAMGSALVAGSLAATSVAKANTPKFADVTASPDSTCVLTTEGNVWCWGGRYRDNMTQSYGPFRITRKQGSLNEVAQVDGLCAVRTDGTVWCWPSFWGGKPVELDYRKPLEGAEFVATGKASCALKRDGTVWCWVGVPRSYGSMAYPELLTLPQRIRGTRDCYLDRRGQSRCNGGNPCLENGKCAEKTHERGPLPIQLSDHEALTEVTDVDVGAVACAVRRDSSLWCWGGSNRTLADLDGSPPDEVYPKSFGKGFASVSVGYTQVCAIKTDDSLWCGQMPEWPDQGLPGELSRARPGNSYASVDLAGDTVCGLRADGGAECWGGDLVSGLEGTLSEPGGAVAIANAGSYACAIGQGADLWCWGRVMPPDCVPPRCDGQVPLIPAASPIRIEFPQPVNDNPKERAAKERILLFHSDIVVHEDGTLTVTETIRVRAEGAQIKRGIFRDFPTERVGRFGERVVVDFEVGQVMRDDEEEPYRLMNMGNGVRVYIGNPDVTLSHGVHTYALKYTTSRQLGFFDEHDELYFNITGNGWAFPITRATATVSLPASVPSSAARMKGYTGAYGSKAGNYTSSIDADGRLSFETTKSLQKRQGFTIEVTWPKGHVLRPSLSERAKVFERDNRGLVVFSAGTILLLIYYFVAWLLVGRDPKRGAIIPRFSPPTDVSPAVARFLMQMEYDHKCFAAALLSLAVKGHIELSEDDGVHVVTRSGARSLMNASPGERAILLKLLRYGTAIRLEPSNHALIRAAETSLKRSLEEECSEKHFGLHRGYQRLGVAGALVLYVSLVTLPQRLFALHALGIASALALIIWLMSNYQSPLKVWRNRSTGWATKVYVGLVYLCAGASIAVLFFAMLWSIANLAAVILLLMPIFSTWLFSHWIPAPTRRGRRLMDHLDGLKMYMSIGERDRLEGFKRPEMTPMLFQTYLPYAVALDVEQEWAEQFSNVLKQSRDGETYRPMWYDGGGLDFTHDLGSSLATSVGSASAASSDGGGWTGGGGGSSGGGGGGGGGSSGGGGGGGGGGGW